MTTPHITGRLAIAIADMLGLTLNKYADPVDPAATRAAGISVELAREIAKQDPSLLWLDGEQVAAALGDEAVQDLAVEADAADDVAQMKLCAVALGHASGDRVAARVACARVIAEARSRR